MLRCIAAARRWWPAALLLTLPTAAYAHTSLRRSEPSKDARLSAPPTRIALWFTARPQLAFSRITLRGPAGPIPLGPLATDTGNALRAAIPSMLAPGDYTVEWQTASADGHAIRGEIRFVVLSGGDAGAAPARAAIAPPQTGMAAHTAPESAHEEHTEYHTARWIEFVALLTVLGVLGFRHGVLPPLAARGVPTSDAGERARRYGTNVLVLYIAAVLVRGYEESVAIHGEARALEPQQLMPMLTSTVWGIGWLFGAIGALSAAAGWMLARRGRSIGTPVALTGALGMVLYPSLSGHAAASPHFVLSVMLDVAHTAAAGLWVGGLLMVLVAGVPAMRKLANGNANAAVSALVNSFHPLALLCAPIVIFAGVGSAWLRLGSVSALWQTQYGLTLFRKTVLVLLVLAIGAYNAFRARRRLGDDAGVKRLVVSGALELALVALVLAVTTILVTQPVPAEAGLP